MRYFALFALLLLAPITLLGCEEDVAAVVGADASFSMYGVLNPRSDTQFVRVYSVENRLERGTAEPLDASMSSTDRTGGHVVPWSDSLIVSPHGGVEHIFWAPFKAEYGHLYHLRIERPDGRASWADVQVPERAQLLPGDARTVGRVVIPLHVRGKIPRLLKTEVVVTTQIVVGYSPSGIPLLHVAEHRIAYSEKQGVRRTDDGWRIDFDLNEAYQVSSTAARTRSDFVRSEGVMLLSVTARTLVGNAEWSPPGDSFDIETLMQPGTMSNVENGFGFVASGYYVDYTWRPAAELVTRTGFRACC